MSPPNLLPLNCAACGQPITAEQFSRAVERIKSIKTLRGYRQVSSGPCHAECLAAGAPYPVEHSPRPGVTVAVMRGCTPGKTSGDMNSMCI